VAQRQSGQDFHIVSQVKRLESRRQDARINVDPAKNQPFDPVLPEKPLQRFRFENGIAGFFEYYIFAGKIQKLGMDPGLSRIEAFPPIQTFHKIRIFLVDKAGENDKIEFSFISFDESRDPFRQVFGVPIYEIGLHVDDDQGAFSWLALD